MPHEPELIRLLLFVVLGGTGAFAVAVVFLWLFWRSLGRESEEHAPRLSRRSAFWLVALVVSLLGFSLVFFVLAFD